MKESRISLRYAKALFELAEEQNILEPVYEDMQLLQNVCKANKDFRLMLHSPIIKADKKQSILKDIFHNKINSLSLSFIIIIARKRREFYLDGIASKFIEFYKEYKNIVTAHITTAAPLTDSIRKKILSLVKNSTKKDVELIEKIKENIIGGFILNFNEKQFDDSISTKIIRLKREYNINIYEKGF